MTMLRLTLMGAAVGVLGVLLAAPARADDDTVRLGGSIEGRTTTLSFDGQSDTELARGIHVGHSSFHGGGFHGGHFHAASFRHANFYHHSFRGYGYRPFYGGYGYGGYYRPYYAGYYGGYGYGGYGYGGYGGYCGYGYGGYGGYGYGYGCYTPCYYPTVTYVAPYYTCAPTVYYSPGYSYYGVAGQVQGGPAQNLQQPGSPYLGPTQKGYQPMPPANGGTYPYDGGPSNPVPLPKNGDQAPVNQPAPKTLPADGRLVSIPATQPTAAKAGNSNFAYPAYGQQTGPSGFAADRAPAVKVVKNN
jgi:hypothetical protein